jgi:lipopolysaccharide transport system ATP-binding protein
MSEIIQPAIVVENLGKCYTRASTQKPRTFMEAALKGFQNMRPEAEFWALKDVSFSVAPGQMLGVLGHNGAGKSTLLQVVSGIVRADRGSVQVAGRMGALLDIGAGFHPDLTGRENILISAVVGGLTRREAKAQFDSIVAFSELEAFIDNPLRTYSTGMQMRLGFAVAIHTVPDVLLVDEFLSVGDIAFQSKCLDRIMQLKNNGCAIVLISHNADQVRTLCDQALWLRHGETKAYGDPESIATRYMGNMDLKAQGQALHQYSQEIRIEKVYAMQGSDRYTGSIDSGEAVKFVVRYHSDMILPNAVFNLSLCDEEGQIAFNASTAGAGLKVPIWEGFGEVGLWIDRLDLAGKQYYINIGIHSADWSKTYDYHWQRYPFAIHWTPEENSILNPPRHWEMVMGDRWLPLRYVHGKASGNDAL